MCVCVYIYTHTYFLLFFTAKKEGKIRIWIYLGHLMQRADSLEKTMMLRKSEGKRSRGQQRKKWLDSITDSMDVNLKKLWKIVKEKPGILPSMGLQSGTT